MAEPVRFKQALLQGKNRFRVAWIPAVECIVGKSYGIDGEVVAEAYNHFVMTTSDKKIKIEYVP